MISTIGILESENCNLKDELSMHKRKVSDLENSLSEINVKTVKKDSLQATTKLMTSDECSKTSSGPNSNAGTLPPSGKLGITSKKEGNGSKVLIYGDISASNLSYFLAKKLKSAYSVSSVIVPLESGTGGLANGIFQNVLGFTERDSVILCLDLCNGVPNSSQLKELICVGKITNLIVLIKCDFRSVDRSRYYRLLNTAINLSRKCISVRLITDVRDDVAYRHHLDSMSDLLYDYLLTSKFLSHRHVLRSIRSVNCSCSAAIADGRPGTSLSVDGPVDVVEDVAACKGDAALRLSGLVDLDCSPDRTRSRASGISILEDASLSCSETAAGGTLMCASETDEHDGEFFPQGIGKEKVSA